MKKPFQVGDRVRVYDGGFSRNGSVSEPPEGPHPGGSIWVMFDKPFFGRTAQDCHPKQCRRLKPKRKPKDKEFQKAMREVFGPVVEKEIEKLISLGEVIKNIFKKPKAKRAPRELGK